MSFSRPIEELPPETRTKLRSSQILTSLPQIISELLQNSLDAGARNVEIGVDCEEWTCWVRDDGIGLSKDGMNLLAKGSEEGRYGTTKAYSTDSLRDVFTFGFRGEALASAADVSCLEISSRTSMSRQSWSVILKGGKSLYEGPSIRWRRESPGTVVCIRDVFYNLPIRRLSHPSPARSLELIRQEIENFALVFPGVSFALDNTNSARASSSNGDRVLRVPKTSTTLATFRHLFGRALIEHVEEIDVSLGDMKLEGFISLHGAHSKSYQFFYVNRHPVMMSDLQRVIDINFSNSTFMKHAYNESGEIELPRSSVRRSPRKSEKKPVYVLNITVPPKNLDNCLDPAKSFVQFQDMDTVSSFLDSTIKSFLEKHGFISQKRVDHRNATPSPRKRRKVVPTADGAVAETSSTAPSLDSRAPLDMTNMVVGPLCIDSSDDEDLGAQEIIWKDPRTGETFVVDKRTGNSYPQELSMQDEAVSSQGSYRHTSIQSQWLKKVKDPSHPVKDEEHREPIPDWIEEALQANTTYEITEPKISSLPLPSSFLADQQDLDGAGCFSHNRIQGAAIFWGAGNGITELKDLSRRFERSDLRHARMISQVDKKFIACLINQEVVLVDQHAADERVRVERFLRELCLGFTQCGEIGGENAGVIMRELSPAVPVLLTSLEASKLGNSEIVQRAFGAWGFRFENLQTYGAPVAVYGIDNCQSTGYVQVWVRSIPEVVSDKLLLGDELQEVVKGFLAKLETDVEPSSVVAGQELMRANIGAENWFRALRWCPRELLDLVNSKACRGAIMFNDSLTLDQCERLIRRLADTTFPFQCAHGRPSLVPLVNIGAHTNGLFGRDRSELRWSNLG